MEDLRRYFSSEAIKKLKNLITDFQTANCFSDAHRLELFRTLHTVKGSSQTFGFASAGFLAHQLEFFLTNIQIKNQNSSNNSKNIFAEGVELLIASLEDRHFEIPASFIEKINLNSPDIVEKNDLLKTFLDEIPTELLSQLSNQEKITLASALNSGKNLYILPVEFDSTNFAEEFRRLRKILSETNEIIATLPNLELKETGKLGFRFVFAGFLSPTQIKNTAELRAAEIIFDAASANFSSDLPGVLSQIAAHGKALAKKFDKKIEFDILAEQINFSPSKLNLIFDVLMHLTRNAIDHGIRNQGKIKISLKVEKNNLHLSISDDGRGIDADQIKVKAVERKLISGDESLSEQEIFDLIFQPEFSTAAQLTEISGRGIGLDAVKNAVEKAGGKIFVESAANEGTTFEIFLPHDK